MSQNKTSGRPPGPPLFRAGCARLLPRWFLLLFCLRFAGDFNTSAGAEPRVVAAWEFNQSGVFEGWRPNGHIVGASVVEGCLVCVTSGDDPILELTNILNFDASTMQMVEIRLEADRDGPAEIFWSGTTQGKYGGFSGSKSTPFQIAGGEIFRTYRILPGWHPEKRIVRLRLDLFTGARFRIDSIRILEFSTVQGPRDPDFLFGQQGAAGWLSVAAPSAGAGPHGLELPACAEPCIALSPPCEVDAERRSYLALTASVSPGARARLVFMTAQKPGLHAMELPFQSDGREHLVNVDLLQSPEWKGTVVALGLQTLGPPGTLLRVRRLSVVSEPQGPPELRVVAFTPTETLPRVGRSTGVRAIVANVGGQPAGPLRASLDLPRGVSGLAGPSPAALTTRLGHGDETILDWSLAANEPLTNRVRLLLEAPGANSVEAYTVLAISGAPPRGEPVVQVPAPMPVRGPYEVGVYYFPGWNTDSRWHPIRRFPERKPALGWYREGDPEVADWHIKWAVEHGITFFAYDWYWSAGARQLEHALHQGFFQARYRHLLKFCLLWANHNPPGTHSIEDSRAVARYWIEHYLRRPEYLRIQGRPLLIVFSPYNLTSDLGPEGARRALEAMREECRHAGLPPLLIAACVSGFQDVASQGYDAVTAYTWPSLGVHNDERRAPYESLLPGYLQQWERLRDLSRVPVLLPICGGWDSRPWHGESALVRHDRSPALFQRHLQDARRLLVNGPARTNLLPAVLIEAWNEWGEGAYIEPHQEHGFAYLDAIRDVFVPGTPPHTDLTPADVGLGPYDVPREVPREPLWTFDRGLEGWDSTMHTESPGQAEGVLFVQTTGNDPAIFGPPMEIPANRHPRAVVRLRLTAPGGPFKDQAQLFWSTRRWPESEASSWRFPVEGDGQWHEYQLSLAQNPRWAGIITRLRLDPCSRSGVRVELDRLELPVQETANPTGGRP